MEADIEAEEEVAVEDVAVKNVPVEDVAVENMLEDMALDTDENRDDASASENLLAPLDTEENNDSKQVDVDIVSLAEQIQQNEPSEENATDLIFLSSPIETSITKVMEISKEAPQISSDGGITSGEMPKYSEDNSKPGHSNLRIKKKRNVRIFIFEKREILPRKSKTKAYEYLKNIARGFYSGAIAGDRRRVRRKMSVANVRGFKFSSQKHNGGRSPTARRSRVAVRHSSTGTSSGMPGSSSSDVSSRYNYRFT